MDIEVVNQPINYTTLHGLELESLKEVDFHEYYVALQLRREINTERFIFSDNRKHIIKEADPYFYGDLDI